jgi:hypothetical protein
MGKIAHIKSSFSTQDVENAKQTLELVRTGLTSVVGPGSNAESLITTADVQSFNNIVMSIPGNNKISLRLTSQDLISIQPSGLQGNELSDLLAQLQNVLDLRNAVDSMEAYSNSLVATDTRVKATRTLTNQFTNNVQPLDDATARRVALYLAPPPPPAEASEVIARTVGVFEDGDAVRAFNLTLENDANTQAGVLTNVNFQISNLLTDKVQLQNSLKQSPHPVATRFRKIVSALQLDEELTRKIGIVNWRTTGAGFIEKLAKPCKNNPWTCGLVSAGTFATVAVVGAKCGADWSECENPAKEACKNECFDGYTEDDWDYACENPEATCRKDETGQNVPYDNTRDWSLRAYEGDVYAPYNAKWHNTMIESGVYQGMTDDDEGADLYCTWGNLSNYRNRPGVLPDATCGDYCEHVCSDAYPGGNLLTQLGDFAEDAVEFSAELAGETLGTFYGAVAKGVFDGLFGKDLMQGLLVVVVTIVGLMLFSNLSG